MDRWTEGSLQPYETDDGTVVAFADGADGAGGGLLVFRAGSGWSVLPRGGTDWDAYHQLVHRQHRAARLAPEDLARRGIPAPPTDRLAATPAVAWRDGFAARLDLRDVPAPVLGELRSRPRREASVHLVLFEDLYETAFGDGRFLYPEAAFWDDAAALAFLRRKEDEEARRPRDEIGRAYTRKLIRLRADEAHDALLAELGIAEYERYSIVDVVRLLR